MSGGLDDMRRDRDWKREYDSLPDAARRLFNEAQEAVRYLEGLNDSKARSLARDLN
jgi:hypothetical protein